MLFNAIAGRADRKWVVMGGARSWAVGFLGGFTQPVQRPCHAPLVRAKSIQPALRFWPPRNNKNSKKKKQEKEKELYTPLFLQNGCNGRMSSTTSPSARQSDICR